MSVSLNYFVKNKNMEPQLNVLELNSLEFCIKIQAVIYSILNWNSSIILLVFIFSLPVLTNLITEHHAHIIPLRTPTPSLHC